MILFIYLTIFQLGLSQPTPNFLIGQTNFASSSIGTSTTNLNSPTGIAVDASGGVYCSDNGNNRVIYFPKGSVVSTQVYGQQNSFLTKGSNQNGLSASSLSFQEGIALDSNGKLYIADTGNSRVTVYPKGNSVATFSFGQAGSLVSGVQNLGGVSASSLNKPFDVSVDAINNVYISDTSNNRVLFYNAGSSQSTRVYGQTLFTTNIGGTSSTGLFGPTSVALDNLGNVYISDSGNNRITIYSGTSTTSSKLIGQTSFSTGSCGVSSTLLCDPRGIALDSNNNLYVSDYSNSRVLMFPSGTSTATVLYGQSSFSSSTSNANGISANSLSFAPFVALDSNNSLFISDGGNSRILCFGCSSAGTGTTTSSSATTKPANSIILIPQFLLLALLFLIF
jgi:sugar lactone lactonase YvrE